MSGTRKTPVDIFSIGNFTTEIDKPINIEQGNDHHRSLHQLHEDVLFKQPAHQFNPVNLIAVHPPDNQNVWTRYSASNNFHMNSHTGAGWQMANHVIDFGRMTRKDLQRWVEKAYGGGLPGATVPWVAAGSPHGHAIAFASGPTCAAGARDGKTVFAPLESRASGPALVRRAKALGYHAEDAAEVCRAAREQPGIARGVVDAAATELAAHVAILVNALDPSLVVLGGGLGAAPGRYWNSFRAALPRFAWGRYARRTRVRRARLGARGGLIGAALSAVEAEEERSR